MAKFWARIGVTLEVDDKELEGKTLEEISQMLEKQLKDFKKRVDTEKEYLDGDAFFPIWFFRESLIEANLISKEVTEKDVEVSVSNGLEFDL